MKNQHTDDKFDIICVYNQLICHGLNLIIYFMLVFIYSVDSCSYPLRPEARSCRVAHADKSFSSGRNRATPLVSEQLLAVA